MKFSKILLLCLCSLFVIPAGCFAEDLVITIKGIENNKGNMRIGIFTSDENFRNKKSYKMLTYSKQNVSKGTMVVRISLPPGEYGVSLLDDENKNEKMDFNIIHIPKEGFGFSEYYHTSLTMPQFKNFSFKLAENSTASVSVKVRYM